MPINAVKASIEDPTGLKRIERTYDRVKQGYQTVIAGGGSTSDAVAAGLLLPVADTVGVTNWNESYAGTQLITNRPLSGAERWEGGIVGTVQVVSTAVTIYQGAGMMRECPLKGAKRINCFPPETLVGTESGLRPMSQIGVGQRVWGYDFLNGVWRLCRVECRHDANYDGPMVTLYADVGKVTATAFHPFWVIQGDDLASRPTPRHVGPGEDQGGSLPGRWVNSHDLREGDVIFLKGRGPVTVRQVVQRHEQTPVCNLTVEELHTFAVGEMQALVHNQTGSHPIPASTDLANLASTADRGGLTKAGRSLAKHGGGKRAGSSSFPDPKGNPAQINALAKQVLDDILNDPARIVKQRPGRPGEQLLQISRQNGSGVIYKWDGTQWQFSHFAENLY